MKFLEKIPKTPSVALSLITTVLIGLVDSATGYELGFGDFYLLPVLFVTWVGGLWFGAVLALLATVLQMAVNQGFSYSSPFYLYWNGLINYVNFLILVLLLVTVKKALYRERQLARKDSLTGIANRQAFYEQGQIEIERSRRHHTPVTMIFIDCDNFKQVNDKKGHVTGDRLLVKVALTIREHIRATDLVARFGGDEFAVLLPDSNPEIASTLLLRLQEKLLATMEANEWPVTFSAGCVTFLAPVPTIEVMLEKADELMYQAKSNGKNQIEVQNLLI